MSLPAFREFVLALHGRPSYVWQDRAAAELAASGWWPALRAPTGAGKTTLIECWLHALAVAGPDPLGRRLVWVVDRRSVVDQVYAHAEAVIQSLNANHAPELSTVAVELRAIGGGVAPRAVLWRGGLDDEAAIAMRDPLDPAAVAVVVSTVDQLGSRLLFRGYGLGIGSRALHAGLLGLDTTVVVDEAHIAEPLRRTVARIAQLQDAAPRPPRPSLRFCAVSATHAPASAFHLSDAERDEPAIARRVAASKRARLVAHRPPKGIPSLVRALGDGGAKVIAVVLNTVTDAQAAFNALASVASTPIDDRVLLVGPIRPLDRADLLEAIPDRAVRADRERPFVVVATQTIEVGVDLDFDALVSACAPLDALVQRFGRLDRAGVLGTSDAYLVAPPARGCPVYGEATIETWKWLGAAADDGAIDMGVDAIRGTIARCGDPPPGPAPRSIRLLDIHVDALAVTDGTEEAGPEVELLLHGDRHPSAEVAVAWRRLPPPTPSANGRSDEIVQTELELRPLHPGEVVTLSLSAVRRWLASADPGVLSDVESIGDVNDTDATRTRREITAWRIGADASIERITNPRAITPTDRVLVSADAGGLDRFGWAPGELAEVPDLGSLAARGPRMILDPDDRDVAAVAAALASGDLTASDGAKDLTKAIGRALPSIAAARPTFSTRVQRTLDTLASGRASLLEDGRVLVVGRGTRSEDASTGQIVTLDRHEQDVDAKAARTVATLGLNDDLCAPLRRAARHHDEGKRDPRFQAWLRGGRAVDVAALAKAAYPYDPRRVRRLRESSGWPAGKRDELVSARAVARGFPGDHLAAWLVATHHGRNRPFLATVDDPAPEEIATTIDGRTIPVPSAGTPSVSSQLATLVELSREHGPWGLAFLEALLISADRAVSVAEGTS